MILCIKHIAIEGPETLGKFFVNKGFVIKEVDLFSGQALPDPLSGIEAVIVLGGPMNVYEEDEYPYLKAENVFIQRVLAENIPFLGICLGSQLLAKAAGAQVGKSPSKEVGWFDVDLAKDGDADSLFDGISSPMRVFQWHEDFFQVPVGGVKLASSKLCPQQAFRTGLKAYGLQFHIEITEKSIISWCDAYLKGPDRRQQKQRMLSEYLKNKEKFQFSAEQVYNNFLKIVNSCGGGGPTP